MNSALTFLREVRVELGKVSWPSRQQMIQYTAVVLGLCLFFALFLGGLDSLFANILKRFIGQ
jgi:preprotein translocase subunit SecE